MAYDNLKKQSIEPLVLVELQYDSMESFVDDFESTLPDKFSFSKNFELDKTNKWSGNSSVKFDVGYEDKIIFDFEDLEGITLENDSSNSVLNTTNYVQGSKCIHWEKSAGSSVSTNVKWNIEDKNMMLADFQQMGVLACSFYISSDSEADDIDKFILTFWNNNNTSFALYNALVMNIKAGWNTVLFFVNREPDSVTSFDSNELLDHIKFEIYTKNSTDTLTDIGIDSFRIYNGPDCYIEETIEDFSDYQDFTATDDGTVADGTLIREGTGSTLLTKSTTVSQYAGAEKTLSVDFSRSQIARLDFHVTDNDYANLQWVGLILEKTNGKQKYFLSDILKTGWNTVYIDLEKAIHESSAFYSYEGRNDIVKIKILCKTHNATDLLTGVTLDSLSFPGDKANEIDLPFYICDETIISTIDSGTNLSVVDDKTNINSRHSLSFDSDTSSPAATLYFSSLNSLTTYSDRLELRHSQLMAIDYKVSATDESKLYLTKVVKAGGSEFYYERGVGGNLDESIESEWNTMYFNVNSRHYLNSPLESIYFKLTKNNTTDTLTDARFANLRTIKRNGRFSGKTKNSSLKDWNYFPSSIHFKPLYWDISDNSILLEKNARNFKDANTLRMNNDTPNLGYLYQEKDNNQGGIPSAPADLLIYPNTDGNIEFSSLVYCENVEVVRLRVYLSDGNEYTSKSNTMTNNWEKLSVNFQVDDSTVTIDGFRIEVISGSGNVDICEPKLVPYRFSNRPDYHIINSFDNVNELYRDESYRLEYSAGLYTTINNSCEKLINIEIDHYNKIGTTFVKNALVEYCWFNFDFHGSFKEHQKILLDVYIKDTATINKLAIGTELHLSRKINSDGYTGDDVSNSGDEIVLIKDTSNHVFRVGWNTLSWTVGEKTQDDSSTSTWRFGSYTPRTCKLRFETNDKTDTFASGDIVVSNLRTLDGEPYNEILQVESASNWTGLTPTDSTDFIFSGDKSIKFTADSIVSNETSRNFYADLSDVDHLYFAVYSEDWSNVNHIDFKFGNGVTDEYVYNIVTSGVLIDNQWVLLRLNLHVGNRSIGSAYGDRIQINNTSKAILSKIETLTINVKNTLAVDSVIYFGGIFSDNFVNLPYLDFTEPTYYSGFLSDVNGTDSFTTITDGGYNSQICLEATKIQESNNEFQWDIDDTMVSLSLRNMKKLYQPIYIPSTHHSKIEKVRLILSKDKSTTASGLIEKSVPIADIEYDKWQLLEFDFSDEEDANLNDMVTIEKIYGRIDCVNTSDTFSGVKLGAIITECSKVFQGGIVSTFNNSLTQSNYIGFKLYVPDEETLANIDSVNLISSVNYDYTDSRFYKKDNTNFVVGWNDVKYHIEDDVLFDSKKTTTEDTNLIKNFKVYVKSVNGFELNAIQIDRFATYNEDTDEVLRTSKIDIVGLQNGKHWEGRLLKANKIKRKMSEETSGLVELPSSKFSLSDTDSRMAEVYTNFAGASNFLNNEVSVSIGTEDDKESEFLQLAKTYIDNISFSKKTCEISAGDSLEQYMIDLPVNLITEDDFTGIEDSENSKPAPIIYNEVSSPIGALPIQKIGEVETNVTWYCVAGHACKYDTCEVYHDKVQITQSDTNFGWSIDYNYTVNNNTYTIIKVPMVLDASDSEWKNPWEEDIDSVSTAPEHIAINISGKTVDGSPYSDVMTSVTECLYDLLTVELGLPSSRIDTSNFSEIELTLTQQNQEMAGAIVETKNAEEVIANMLLSHNIHLYPNPEGQVSLYLFKAQKYDTTATLFTDEIDIIEGSFKVNTGVDNLVNRIKYRCNFNYSDQYGDEDNSWEYNNLEKDDDSYKRIGTYKDWEDEFLEMRWIRNSSVARDIVVKLLLRFKNGRPGATLTLPVEAWDKDLADKIRITHYDGVSISRDKSDDVGWEEHLCVIKSLEFDMDNYKVTIGVDNVQDLATDCAFLGDNSTFTFLWADATEEERTYLYLANDGATTDIPAEYPLDGSVDQGKMSDDETDGKRLC